MSQIDAQLYVPRFNVMDPDDVRPFVAAVATAQLVTVGEDGVPDATEGPGGAAAIDQAVTPWQATADAGIAIGQGSHKAAVVTAGFFSRMSKSITRVF